MRKIKLTSEEKEIMSAIENDEFVAVKGEELKAVADAIAARKKDATLTLRVNKRDINKIKMMTCRKGIHYQTYIAEIIHKVAEAI
ncbi:MAG: antitoxin [Candidatus Omnitrophica bacterium]|nr:antitoxin [Candidatus Omnitrophota bacterium]